MPSDVPLKMRHCAADTTFYGRCLIRTAFGAGISNGMMMALLRFNLEAAMVNLNELMEEN